MSGALIVSGGGVAVATDGMLAATDTCSRLAGELAGGATELRVVARRLDDWALPGPAGAPLRIAADRCALASGLAAAAEDECARLALALRLAAEGYGIAESAAGRAAEAAAELVAAAVGRLLPGLALAAAARLAPLAAVVALVAPRAAAALGLTEQLHALGAHAAGALSDLVSDPRTVAVIRQAVMAADDLALGALGMPAPLIPLLGEDGLGLAGLPFAATLLAGLAGTAGPLRETPIRLAESRVVVEAGPADAPTGWAERFDRILSAGPGTDGMQVLIERYEMPDGTARFEVYVTGTVTFDPVPAGEPWDMTSNVGNARGADAASVRAVAEAMRAAGVDATTPVVLNGYSQGGGIVARVATLPEFNVVGLVAFGGNTGQTPIPESVDAVLVEHRDDLVPALGGRQDNDHALLVERVAYGQGAPPPEGVVVPAHRRPAYAETAALMDGAESERLRAATARFDAFTEGATTVTATEYRFERTEG